MWWAPILNLSLITFLITILTIRLSVCSFTPALRRNPAYGSSCERRSDFTPVEPSWAAAGVFDEGDEAPLYLISTTAGARALTEWWLDYSATRWFRNQPLDVSDTDLVEARFHLANAEVFDLAIGNPQRATAELDLAASYLAEAQARAEDPKKAALVNLWESLEQLKRDRKANTARAKPGFKSVKLGLDQLIARLHGG